MSGSCVCDPNRGPHNNRQNDYRDVDDTGELSPREVSCKEGGNRPLTLAESSIVKFFEGLSLVAGAYTGYFLAHFVRQHPVGCFVLLVGSIFFRVFFAGDGNKGEDRRDV